MGGRKFLTWALGLVGLASADISRFDSDVQQIVRSMTTKEKIGQMVQININMVGTVTNGEFVFNDAAMEKAFGEYFVGSVLNSPLSGNVPPGSLSSLSTQQWQGVIKKLQDYATNNGSKVPMLYGIDSIHGANYVSGATLFPQQINAGCSFNRDLVEKQGWVTAKDTRAAGIPWIFAPILGIAIKPTWPRVYETFGEDPYINSELGAALIKGMQGFPADLKNKTRAAACMKHFIGYSDPLYGHDRNPSWIPDRMLWNYFAPPFQAAVDAGVATAMESYNDINGVPLASSYEYTVNLLRKEMKWDGMLVTDWAEIKNLHTWHKIASTPLEAVRLSMQGSSVDMSMVPEWDWNRDVDFPTYLEQLVDNGKVSIDRVEESAARIVQLKKNLGLLEDPTGFSPATVTSPADKQASLDLARESIVLTENPNSFLPLSTTTVTNVLVVGPTGNSQRRQNGGWSIHWQGARDDEFTEGVTVFQGVKALLPGATVDYIEGCVINDPKTCLYSQEELNATLLRAAQADVIIACFGEDAYTELPGDIDDLGLAQGQREVLTALSGVGKPVVLVLLEGRPRVLYGLPSLMNAVLLAWLPGPWGGQAIAEIIFGKVNPSGKLSLSYPRDVNALPPYWHSHSVQNVYPQWPFGHGMSFSNITYESVVVTPQRVTGLDDVITIEVKVVNSGPVACRESVLLFVQQEYRAVTPEVSRLRRFEKVSLGAGESTTVKFELTARKDLWFTAANRQRLWEDGDFQVVTHDKSTTFTLDTGSYPATVLKEPLPGDTIINNVKEGVSGGLLALYLIIFFIAGIVATVIAIRCNRRRSNAYEDIHLEKDNN